MARRSEPEIRTPRLHLRRWRSADVERMQAINRDPEVHRYLNFPPGDDWVDHARRHWEVYGYGAFAADLVAPGDDPVLVGFIGVAHPPLAEVADRVELGWRLARDAWGKGLATEGALAVREWAMRALELDDLISVIHPDNARSQRVATKLGMSVERHVFNPVMDRDVEVWRYPAG